MFNPIPLKEMKLKFEKFECELISEDNDININFLKSISSCELVLIRNATNPKHYIYLNQQYNHISFEKIYRSKVKLIIRNEEYKIFVTMKTENINKMFATFNPINTSQMMFVIDTNQFNMKEINSIYI